MGRAACLVVVAAIAGVAGCRGTSARPPGDDRRAAPPAAAASAPATRPHPDYPTPKMAGTEELFLIEEPPRGPHVTSVRLPDRNHLRFTEHAVCEVAAARLICSGSRAKPGQARWNVGRSGEKVILAERLTPTGRVLASFLFDWDPGGRLARLSALEEHGLVEWTRSFNPPGERYMERALTGANNLAGCGAMAMRGAGDNHGRVEHACLQWNGSPMRDTNGVAYTVVKHDWQGFPAERVRLGLDRKPVAGHDRVHRTVTSRDAVGRPMAELNFGLDGKPAMSMSAGCTGRRFEYDDRGVLVRETCLGADGTPARADEGVAVTVHETNADGCVVRQTRLDRDGKPTHVRGVYGLRHEPDAWCNGLAETCLGALGEPVACGPEGPARTELELDERGRAVSVRHRGPDGDPGRDAEFGVFELRRGWDALGNLVEESCWGASGEAIECDHTGFHAQRIAVDDAGRTREIRYLDAGGAPATNLGVAVRRYIYDNYDHLHEIDGFDESGDFVEALGMAAQRRLYDPGHRLFALILLDKAGKPARYTGCFTGRDCPARDWHAVRIYRGPNGRVVKNVYFDADGQLVETMDCDQKRCW
jgi:hypothetical protein